MEKIILQGGNRLEGKISIAGMKNSALPILFATLLISGDCVIDNLPLVSDVYHTLEILEKMGARIIWRTKHCVQINTENCDFSKIDNSLVSKMRASYYLMGASVGKAQELSVLLPGGCNFGARPIDFHLKGFEQMGVSVETTDRSVHLFNMEKKHPSAVSFDTVSVGATVNMILASVKGKGTTIVKNSAKEPHIDDLIDFLNQCGGKIRREKDDIVVEGVPSLRGVSYVVAPDMIETGTFLCLIGICQGKIELQNANPVHLAFVLELLKRMGMSIRVKNRIIFAKCNKKLNGCDIITMPYPLFPTDLHPQFASLLCFCKNEGSIKDTIFPTRFAYTAELRKMGAKILRNGNVAKFYPSKMQGDILDATDLRAGAGLVLAGLGATGVSEIHHVPYIVRGYEDFVPKIASLGGNIIRIKE